MCTKWAETKVKSKSFLQSVDRGGCITSCMARANQSRTTNFNRLALHLEDTHSYFIVTLWKIQLPVEFWKHQDYLDQARCNTIMAEHILHDLLNTWDRDSGKKLGVGKFQLKAFPSCLEIPHWWNGAWIGTNLVSPLSQSLRNERSIQTTFSPKTKMRRAADLALERKWKQVDEVPEEGNPEGLTKRVSVVSCHPVYPADACPRILKD